MKLFHIIDDAHELVKTKVKSPPITTSATQR